MPLTDGHYHHDGDKRELNGELNELHFNPFDDGIESRSFTSGRASSHHAQYFTRRRGDSESASSSSMYNPNPTPSSVHSRARTVSDHASGPRDPLSSRSSTSQRHDAGSSTRPRLARALSSWASETEQPDELNNSGNGNGVAPSSTSSPDESQRLVLVHQVRVWHQLRTTCLTLKMSRTTLRLCPKIH